MLVVAVHEGVASLIGFTSCLTVCNPQSSYKLALPDTVLYTGLLCAWQLHHITDLVMQTWS